MDTQQYIFLGIKVKPGPIERFKLENFALDKTVDSLKSEAEKKSNIPSASLELIHHGKILKDESTLHESGVKNGEMIHVVKKKVPSTPTPPPSCTDDELQQIAISLRTLGCTPNAPGWTRAMQLLNDESAMAEIMEHAPSLSEDCVTLSILNEVELLAALGANVQTMRVGANARPDLPTALRHLTRLVRSRTASSTTNDNVPISGFAYSLEALSEDEDAEDDDTEDGERHTFTQEQIAAALQRATEAVSSSTSRSSGNSSNSQVNLLRLLTEMDRGSEATPSGSGRPAITSEMFSEAISEAVSRAGSRNTTGTPMEQSNAASSSQSPVSGSEQFATQLQHMHEMGLVNDAHNIRALLICSGDVNHAINLVCSGVIGDDTL